MGKAERTLILAHRFFLSMFVGLHLPQRLNGLSVERLAGRVVDARSRRGEYPDRLALGDRRCGQIAQHLTDGGTGAGIVLPCHRGLGSGSLEQDNLVRIGAMKKEQQTCFVHHQ